MRTGFPTSEQDSARAMGEFARKFIKRNTACTHFELERGVTGADDLSVDEILTIAISATIEVPTECTVELATAFVLIQHAIVRSFRNEKYNQRVFAQDFAQLMEMAWQTIAGDKLGAIFSNPLCLFDLMANTWSLFD